MATRECRIVLILSKKENNLQKAKILSSHLTEMSSVYVAFWNQGVLRCNIYVTRWVAGNLLQEILWLKQVIGPILKHLFYAQPLSSIFWR